MPAEFIVPFLIQQKRLKLIHLAILIAGIKSSLHLAMLNCYALLWLRSTQEPHHTEIFILTHLTNSNYRTGSLQSLYPDTAPSLYRDYDGINNRISDIPHRHAIHLQTSQDLQFGGNGRLLGPAKRRTSRNTSHFGKHSTTAGISYSRHIIACRRSMYIVPIKLNTIRWHTLAPSRPDSLIQHGSLRNGR